MTMGRGVEGRKKLRTTNFVVPVYSRGKGNKGEIENHNLCGFSPEERGTREKFRTTNFVVSVQRRGYLTREKLRTTNFVVSV